MIYAMIRRWVAFLRPYRVPLAASVASLAAIALCLGLTNMVTANGRHGEAQSVAAAPVVELVELDRSSAPAVNAALAAKQAREPLIAKVRANWREPTGTQPDLSQYSDISVDVSLADQMVYVKSAGKVIYEMVASTGINDSTPHGTFRTNGAGGDHFYTPYDHMGADYWTRITGVYLFHSVPTGYDAGDYIESEAVKLGQPASHGCVRLTVADAKWIHEQLPKGTPVTIG